ncbi:histidine kinase [Streptomyces abyssalis]|uniref:histidine kinase n=1 Tax=Streptomyces abyssalis TaxID=933944 RepID=A0A1E7JHA2_9ACTN|nr:nitrate- and nitrite sensing domain-containing protein [Streptomyces abyssalis]OEU85830.1 histidine kinase [Streptomyces abyssalis]OEU92706.1 histidine kinase [Streptomyces abyssalis]
MQGRFKRDGSAAGDPEPRGMTDRGSTPQRAQQSGPTAAVHDEDGAATNRPAVTSEKSTEQRLRTPPGPGSRAALRNWRISTRLVSLLALPVVAATTLGALRIQDSLGKVDQLENMKQLTEMTEQATELAAALQEERDRSAGPLVATADSKDDTVVGPREKTDQSFQAFKEATSDLDGSDRSLAGVQSTVLDITRQLTAIKNIRERAYDNEASVSQTVNSYNQLVDSLLSLSQDMAQATNNSEMIQSTRALAAFSTAKEYASIQRAIISAGLAVKGGPELSESDRLYAKTAAESESASLGSFNQIYGEEKASELTKPLDGGVVNITLADKYRDRVLNNPDGIKSENRSYPDWYDQDRSKIDEMAKIESTLLSQMEQQARELRADAQREAFLNGAVILLVLGISLVGAFVVARSMVRSLRRLQDTAQDVARKRLPELVRQMSESEPQDVDTSVESVGVHSRDEIGKVASAFDDVHREAVRLAGEQALLRGNVNAMFTNLSRRSQGLIQRQLSLISELESREADPDQLSSLFKLDHLATRMRRNGENLLVLAGEEPGRRWTRPVPLVDVLRAAASEVEQYERIELNSVPATEVAGRVVNDLVHLLAELLENATSFSSPQTKVKVTGHALPDGRVLVEIHDTGIGLSPEDLSAINERLASPPTVDVSVSRRMGLFVVGRLSLRHGIRIQLRPSDSGGTTALVMLPVDVAQGGAQGPQGAKGKPAGAGGPGGNGAGVPKGAGLAAALQRGPGSGPGTRQVGGGDARPALPGSDVPVGAGAGPGGGPPTTNLFGDSGQGRGPGPDRPGAGSGPPNRQAPPLPQRPGPAGALPGGAGAGGGQGGPEPAEFDRPAGGWGGSWERESQSTGEFQRPQSPSDTGEFQRPQSPSDTGEFQRPQSPSDTGEFQRPSPSDTGEFQRPQSPSDTGEFQRPPSPSDTGEFQRPEPGGPSDTSQFARPDQWTQARPSWATASGPAEDGPRGHDETESSDTGEFARPGYTGASSGGQGAAPGREEQQSEQTQGGQQPSYDPDFGIPSGPPAAADAPTPIFESIESNWFRAASSAPPPPPPSAPPAQRESAEYATPERSSQHAPTPRPGQPASAVPPMPQRHAARPSSEGASANSTHSTAAQHGADTGAHWGASPNDERWRRAEQVRQPAAGGVTTSGLPRRVPRANLVAGTAQQQSSAQAGPQVSRAPDDVRGRLTNLRRGIQQGRQAGTTNGRGIGPHYQQER